MIDPAFPSLEKTLLVEKNGTLFARKFGENWDQNEVFFKDRAEFMEMLTGDIRMEENQMLIDLHREKQQNAGEKEQSLEQIFQSHLDWATN